VISRHVETPVFHLLNARAGGRARRDRPCQRGACRRYPVRTAYLPLAHCGWYGDLAMGRALIWTEKSIAAIPGAAGSRYDFAAFADVGRAKGTQPNFKVLARPPGSLAGRNPRSAISMNKRLLIAVEHSTPAVPVSAHSSHKPNGRFQRRPARKRTVAKPPVCDIQAAVANDRNGCAP
jgi:hypothetical protein